MSSTWVVSYCLLNAIFPTFYELSHRNTLKQLAIYINITLSPKWKSSKRYVGGI